MRVQRPMATAFLPPCPPGLWPSPPKCPTVQRRAGLLPAPEPYSLTSPSSSSALASSTCMGQSSRPCKRYPPRRPSRTHNFFVQIPPEREPRKVPSKEMVSTLSPKKESPGKGSISGRGRKSGAPGQLSSPRKEVSGPPLAPCDPPAPDAFVLRIMRKCGRGCDEQEHLELELQAPKMPKVPAKTQTAEPPPPEAAKGKKGKKGKGKKGKKGKKK